MPYKRPFQESSVLHILDTQRVCSVGLTTASANLLQPTAGVSSNILHSIHKKVAIGECRGTLRSSDAVVHHIYEQCDTAPYIGSIRSRSPVYCYDSRPIYDTKKYYLQEGWNVTKSGQQHHTLSYIYHVVEYKIWLYTYAIFCSMDTPRIMRAGARIYVIRISAAVHRNMYPYV